MGYGFNTLCVYGNNTVKEKADKTGSISVPIYQTASFAHPGVGMSTGYDYTRTGNPTRENTEDVLAALEKGAGALAFATGMAAISTVIDLLLPGDGILASDDLYGGTVRVFANICKNRGITVDYCDTTDIKSFESSIKENTKLVFVETPSNPLMKVTDLKAVAQITKSRGIYMAVDNTFLSPYFQRPIELGANIVIHSGTKYLGGHNDTLSGFLVADTKELYDRLKWLQNACGGILSPFDSFLVSRGIKTLPLRMDRAQENAFKIVDFLKNHKKVERVYYPGDKENEFYELSTRQASGFGAMISFRVNSADTAVSLLHNIKLISYAESLGGTESLLTYPMLQTHGDVPKEKRDALGITDAFLRMSVGVENAEDLINDLEQALS